MAEGSALAERPPKPVDSRMQLDGYGPMRRKSRDADLTRQSIVNAAELEFCESGYGGATLEIISRRAGVTRGAFYWHFRDKGEILGAIRSRSLLPHEILSRASTGRMSDDPISSIQYMGVEAFRQFEQDEGCQRLYRLMAHDRLPNDLVEGFEKADSRLTKALASLAQEAAASGALRSDVSPTEVAVIIVSSINGLMSAWLRSNKSFSLLAVGSKMISMQTKMICANSLQGR